MLLGRDKYTGFILHIKIYLQRILVSASDFHLL